MRGHVVVLDIGKSMAKLSLFDAAGGLIARRDRPNQSVSAGRHKALDTAGIEAWLAAVLADFGQMAPIEAIVPVGHGAAVTIIRDGELAYPPLDYEEMDSDDDRASYERERDAFAQTGSPSLPGGLNLGAQLHRLERMVPGLLGDGATIVPWPQYWAWLLSGVAASEVTSLGCHSDLWRPLAGAPSALAIRRGWGDKLAPLRRADAVLGTLLPDWAARTGLPDTVRVHCGLHDSNAALLAARAFPQIARNDATVLSTGTWFVAMRTPDPGHPIDLAALPEARDCLANVDAYGHAIPSARFMGGREIEMLVEDAAQRIDIAADQPALLAAVPRVLDAGAMVLPGFVPGAGPFPRHRGQWIARPVDAIERRTAIALYAALVADTMLSLIGARDRILVEGRFAQAEPFVRALARLRPDCTVYTSSLDSDASFGARRLLDPQLRPPAALRQVVPLSDDLEGYRVRWVEETGRMEAAA